MGFFGTFSYANGQWTEDAKNTAAEVLVIDIHDSDIATIRFAPAVSGQGCFYLGIHPRDYFDDPAEGVAVDVEREGAAFCAWASRVVGSQPDVFHVVALMAREGSDEEPEQDFVEEAVAALLVEIGVPLPPGLLGAT